MQDEFDRLPNGNAQRLQDDPLLNEILDKMEKDALERCVFADPSDDEMRRVSTMEVRAIKSLRAQLKTLAEGKAKRAKRGSVA